MKLYTEERVREILKSTHIHTDTDVNMILSNFTPIELPSDEYIEEAEKYPYGGREGSKRVAFIEGAKWVVEYIKKQK